MQWLYQDSARVTGAFYRLAGTHLALTQTRISESPRVHTAHITCKATPPYRIEGKLYKRQV